MIICSCNGLRENDLRDAARRGAPNAKRAYAALGCKPQCGQCWSFAHKLVREEGHLGR